MALKRNALGRGLDSLISMDDVPASGSSAITEIPLSQISANPDQPRRTFDEEALVELADSIRSLGIIQPLSLRKTGPDSFQIIAGAASAPHRSRGFSRCRPTSVQPPTWSLQRWPSSRIYSVRISMPSR